MEAHRSGPFRWGDMLMPNDVPETDCTPLGCAAPLPGLAQLANVFLLLRAAGGVAAGKRSTIDR